MAARVAAGRKRGVCTGSIRFPRPGAWRYSIGDPVMGASYFTVRVAA